MCNTNNVQLPHELLHRHNGCTKQPRISVPNRLQGRALKHKVALIPKNLLGTTHAQTLGPGNPGPAARDIGQTMTTHPELQQYTQAGITGMHLKMARGCFKTTCTWILCNPIKH